MESQQMLADVQIHVHRIYLVPTLKEHFRNMPDPLPRQSYAISLSLQLAEVVQAGTLAPSTACTGPGQHGNRDKV